MLSEEQQLNRIKRVKDILKVISDYKKEDKFPNIENIYESTNIPTSSIQRYLNDDVLLTESGMTDEEITYIKQQLAIKKHQGQIKGGIISSTVNVSLKNEKGHFNGCMKK